MELLRPYLLRGVCYACLRFLDPRTAETFGERLFHAPCLAYVLATQPDEADADEERQEEPERVDRR